MLEQIKLPIWIDREVFFEAFKTKSTLELYDFFRCNNATSFTNMMKKYFPDKPPKMAYAEYVRGLLKEEESD